MSNPWYDKINGRRFMPQAQPMRQTPMNPMAVMGKLSQAMQNPQFYAMQAFKDVPRDLWNNPSQALQYIMQTRGLTQGDIQSMIGSLPIPH